MLFPFLLSFLVPFICSLLIYGAGYRFHRRDCNLELVDPRLCHHDRCAASHLLGVSSNGDVVGLFQYFSVLTVTLFSTLKHRDPSLLMIFCLPLAMVASGAVWYPSAAVIFTYLLHRFWWGIYRLLRFLVWLTLKWAILFDSLHHTVSSNKTTDISLFSANGIRTAGSL